MGCNFIDYTLYFDNNVSGYQRIRGIYHLHLQDRIPQSKSLVFNAFPAIREFAGLGHFPQILDFYKKKSQYKF